MYLDQNLTRFQECSDSVIQWLHDCWVYIYNKEPEKMQPNPFYERNDVLTKEIVEKVITDIEAIFVKELEKYMGYHRGAQGVHASQILVTPALDKLPYLAKRYIVKGLDRILQEYRVEMPPPQAYVGYDGC